MGVFVTSRRPGRRLVIVLTLLLQYSFIVIVKYVGSVARYVNVYRLVDDVG